MNRLDGIVKQMLETHVGGEVFFDHLDDTIRNDKLIIDELINIVPEFTDKNIIVSGSFGRLFFDYIKLLSLYPKSIVWVNGGLRKNAKVEYDLCNYKNKEFIFIDDSYYSGKTRNTIEDSLNKHNSCITETYVVYDGSEEKNENVKSLYRYYK